MSTATRRIGVSLLLLLAALPAAVQAQGHFPADEELELLLRYVVEDGETPGIALGVLEADGTTRAVGYGSGGPGARPVGPRSIFDIGSLTMTFTATLLAEMAGRGEVSLEDPVATYLPDQVTVPSPGGYEMTLTDLATHRSGLPASPRAGLADITVTDLYALVSAAELERPGRRYEFSTLGYALLGHVLSRAAGMRYEELLRERVLDPLGMGRTGYDPDRALAEWLVRGHAGGQVVAPTAVGEAMRGATGLHSSAEDMLRFLSANTRPPETVLGRAMRMAQEIRVERGREDEELGYGFSWRTYSVARLPPIITHGGGGGGFTSLVNLDPEQGIGTVVLANTRAFSDRFGRTLLLFGPPRTRAPAEVDPAVLRQYAGTYRSGQGRYRAQLDRGRYFIRLEPEGYLTYQPGGKVRTRLYAETDSSFYMLRAPYTVTFDRQGDDTRMVIRVDERAPEGRARSWRAWKVDEGTQAPAVVAGNAPGWRTWGPLRWALIGVVGVLAMAVFARSLWSRRSGPGTGRVRSRSAWSRPGLYP